MARAYTRKAKDTPVLTTKIIEASEQPLGYTERVPTATSQAGTARLVDVAEKLPDQEKLAMLAFMNELVTIRVASTTDKNAEQVFELNVNGRAELFRRGEVKTCKRFYVELMARTKPTSYTDREVANNEGIRTVLHDAHTALKYDFSMIRDDNPMGEHWLKATLAMGG
jgi:hypothetical protein